MTTAGNRNAMWIGWVLFVGLLLRLAGLQFGLPFIYHQDEPILVNHALALGVGGLNPHFFVLPPFIIYLLFFLYGFLYVSGHVLGVFPVPTDFAIFFLKDPSWFYLLGRFAVGVIPGVATLYALVVIGKKLFSERIGVLAAFFLAISFIHVQQSHYIYVDVPLALVATLFFYQTYLCARNDRLKNYLFAGALLGCGAAIKYTMLYYAPFFVAILFTEKKPIGFFSLGTFWRLLWAGISSLLVYALLAPYTFLDWTNFYSQIRTQGGAQGYTGIFHHIYYSLGEGMGIFLFILLVLGFLTRSKYSPGLKKTALCLAGGYYVMNVFFGQSASRYAIPLAPLFCLFAALGWESLEKRWSGKKALLNFIFFLGVVATALPSVYSDILFIRKDTRTLAYQWVLENIPSGNGIVVDNRFYAPHLSQTREQWVEKNTILGTDISSARKERLELMSRALPDKTYRIYTAVFNGESADDSFAITKPRIRLDMKEIKNAGANYLIVNYMEPREETEKFISTNKNLHRLISFNPYWGISKKVNQDTASTTAAPHAWRELFSRNRLGPYIEIYKVEPL